MGTFEIILILGLIGLIIYLITKINTISGTSDVKQFGEVMGKLSKLETVIEERSKKQEEVDKKRDELTKQNTELFTNEITKFTRTLSGTQERGAVGEHILKENLNPFVKQGKIITNLKVDNGVVEFGWMIDKNKYIPIDSKFPDTISLYNDYINAEDTKKQKELQKQIVKKLEKNIEEVKKYLNRPNTTNKGILAIPDAIIDMVPEINSDFNKTGVFVVGYQLIAYVATYIEREYQFMTEKGELGEYKELLERLLNIINKIKDKTNPIEKGITMIQNANNEIKKSSIEAENYKLRKKNE